MDQDTIRKVADATKAVAETSDTALKLAGKFGSHFSGPLGTIAKLMDNELQFIAATRSVRLSDKWNAILAARGQTIPTRHIPPNFVVPLLTTAVLEEDDDLQDTWARMLVNAGDASTEMELRVAYVEILKGMSAFDVKNLAAMAEASLAIQPGHPRALLTTDLPKSAERFPGHFAKDPSISREMGISLANLSRLGCAIPAGGFDGAILYTIMTVTGLGLALYQACS